MSTAISKVSIKEIVKWALYVNHLTEESTNIFRINQKTIEDYLNRLVVCELGILGCSIIEREKDFQNYGRFIDVYGYDRSNEKKYYVKI